MHALAFLFRRLPFAASVALLVVTTLVALALAWRTVSEDRAPAADTRAAAAPPPRASRVPSSTARVGTVPFADAPGTQAAMTDHLTDLAATIPRGFHVVVAPPFVVIGDDEPARVEHYADDVVTWAATRLRRDYFAADPRTVDVWLFKDAAGYKRYAAELFQVTPRTPYGFYDPKRNVLIMNISTGRGTLVHEMVHAYVHADFPDCPEWFNEGLASLFEKPGDVDGRFVGYPNWRLPPLQAAIRAGRAPSLEAMMRSGSAAEFHDDPLFYPAARYLCYYLQERGALRRFYRDFRERCHDDPDGVATLRDVLGGADLTSVQQEWESLVLGLTPMDRQLRWRRGVGYQPVSPATTTASQERR